MGMCGAHRLNGPGREVGVRVVGQLPADVAQAGMQVIGAAVVWVLPAHRAQSDCLRCSTKVVGGPPSPQPPTMARGMFEQLPMHSTTAAAGVAICG